MRYLSVCSGIEAASVAWHPLGWRPVAFSEIEPFPSAVLAARWPEVPNLGDMTEFERWLLDAIDILVGGTPCQSFSVAGLRKGLGDARGGLMLTYLRLVAKTRPRWVVWENVPGVLSIDDGRAFGALLGGLAELGYGFAYRILDAQYFGVAQRRRRVFVVGHSGGKWQRAAAVLFERESLRGDSAPSREAWKAVAGTLSARSEGGGGLGTDFDLSGGQTAVAGCLNAKSAGSATQQDAESGLLIHCAAGVSRCLNAGGMGRIDYETETFIADVPRPLRAQSQLSHRDDLDTYVTHALRGEGFDASEDGSGRGTPVVPVAFDTTQITSRANYSNPQPGDPCHPLSAEAHPPAVYTLAIRGRGDSSDLETRGDGTANAILTPNGGRGGIGCGAVAYLTHAIQAGALRENPLSGPDGVGVQPDISYTLEARSEVQAVHTGMAVRRLTPKECCRLQGFPDEYLDIQFRGKPACDGPKYKALGNSMAVPCMRWLGERIAMVDAML